MNEIVVVGDVIVDHHLYEGEGARPGMLGDRGVREVVEAGGAKGLAKLLAEAGARKEPPVSARFIEARAAEARYPPRRAYGTWSLWPIEKGAVGKGKVWRARLLGYAGGPDPQIRDEAATPTVPQRAEVLVVDDADLGFRSVASLGHWLASESPPAWVILKTTAPVARGDLWHQLLEMRQSSKTKIICLLSAHDLRLEQNAISRGLSWERTVSDLHTALSSDLDLRELLRCRHIVITLSADGALWLETKEGGDVAATLFFDPGGFEGGWADGRDGEVTGYLTGVAAALSLWAADECRGAGVDFGNAIAAGLRSMRDLNRLGHGRAEDGQPNGYPAKRLASIAAAVGPDDPFARAKIPWVAAKSAQVEVPGSARATRTVLPTAEYSLGEDWSLTVSSQSPPGFANDSSVLGLARLLVTHGPSDVLKSVPHATFGRLTTLDRHEIEALRGIRSMMREYRGNPSVTRPLSIGIFGPPGAGKSFGVKQLAYQLFSERAWLEFNLSQFERPSDLMGPFHQARDLALAGIVPVVFWDEFDSRELEWLQYLIAPMQDGRFQDGQLSHATGRAVFVFAGGTSTTFDKFAADRGDGQEAFRLKKGPDFVSRLDAYFDVAGPNPPEPESKGSIPRWDPLVPIRRAQLIRHLLAAGDDARVEIDPDLLNALLLVPRYRHGSRSLEKLVGSVRERLGAPVRRSALPPGQRLGMFVDPARFREILDMNAPFRNVVTAQATKIHEAYLGRFAQDDAAGRTVHPRVDQPFERLGAAEKEVNLAAARRTADVLALVGMGVAPRGTARRIEEEEFNAFVEHHLERLAEAEHDGWMAQKLANGWIRGDSKDFGARTHPCLVAYSQLDDKHRETDRTMVRGIWRRISDTNFDVVWLADIFYALFEPELANDLSVLVKDLS